MLTSPPRSPVKDASAVHFESAQHVKVVSASSTSPSSRKQKTSLVTGHVLQGILLGSCQACKVVPSREFCVSNFGIHDMSVQRKEWGPARI